MKNTEFKIASLLEEYRRMDEMQRDFIIHEGYTAIEEIIKEVNQRGVFNEAVIYYGTPKPQLSFSDVELGYMLTSMMEYATNHVGNPVDEECEFENKLAYFEYKDVIVQIFEVYGQGTDSWFLKPSDETIDKLNNTAYGVYLNQFEDFINYTKNKDSESKQLSSNSAILNDITGGYTVERGSKQMIVTAWVLLVVFGLVFLANVDSEGDIKFAVYIGVIKFVSVFIVAIAAGVIWGGLFQ